MGFVPKERKTEGIFKGMKTLANITISSLTKTSQAGGYSAKKNK